MTVQLSPLAVQRFVDNNGNALAGGQLYTYQAGTSTLQATYTDSTGGTANTNPVILNARGEANVWLTSGQAYKFALYDSLNNLIWTVDNIIDASAVLAANLASTTNATLGSALVGWFKSIANFVGRTLGAKLSDQYSVCDYGAVGDGATNNATFLANCPATDLLVPPGTYLVNSNTTISANLRFAAGAILKPASGVTITLSAPFTAPSSQIFDLSAGGVVALPGGLVETDVAWWGAKGDGTTDDSAAIQGAISASYGHTLKFPLPANFYYINSPLNVAGQIRMIGNVGSFIKYGTGLSSSTDVLTYYGSTTTEGIEIEDLWIVEASGTPARDVLKINLDASSGLKKLRISRCMFRSHGGYAVNINNPGTNTNGLFLSVIEKCELNGGILGTNVGDSVTIRDCALTGANIGISIGMLPQSNPSGSSSSLAIESNNITATGGAIVVNPGRNIRICGNNIEQTALLASGAGVQLANIDYSATLGASVVENNKIEMADGVAQVGAIGLFQCVGVAVRNNQLSGSSKTSSFTYTVALTSCNQIKVWGNRIYASTNCVGVNVDSGSNNTSIFDNIYSLASGAYPVNDSGVGTKGIWKDLTYNTNWSRYSSAATNLSYFKSRDGIVFLRGNVAKSGAIVANDLIATLPNGAWPDTGADGGNLRLTGNFYNSGGTSGLAVIRVLAASGSQGQITSADPLTNPVYVSLDGLSFYSPDV